jgi:hypothetical protein
MDAVISGNYYISTGTDVKRPDFFRRGWKVEHKQTAWFIIVVFIVIGILGALAAVAIPHAGEMAYASKAGDRTLELFTIQSAVAQMMCQSHASQIQSIGPTDDLNLVHTTDPDPLALADFLPDFKDGRLTSGYTYSFTSDGLVLQYGE